MCGVEERWGECLAGHWDEVGADGVEGRRRDSPRALTVILTEVGSSDHRSDVILRRFQKNHSGCCIESRG